MRLGITIIFILISGAIAWAQPFVDIISTQHVSFKNSGIKPDRANAVAEGSWDMVHTNFPLQLDSFNLLIFSPSFEYRSVINDDSIQDAYYRTLIFPFTYVHTFSDRATKMSLSGIYRFNADTRVNFGSRNDQLGVALIFFHRRSEKLVWKAGLYFNKEFFYDQWIPFIGADWHISDRLMLFSMLPRYLILDYTITPSLHSGLWFRGVDESYRYITNDPPDYFRITEGYLRAYADYYIPKTRLVTTLAVGHTLQRRYAYRLENTIEQTFPQGALMFQLGLAYRFIVDPKFRTQRESLQSMP